MFIIKVLPGAAALNLAELDRMVTGLKRAPAFSLKDQRLLTRPGLPRMRVDYTFSSQGVGLRMVVYLIPSDTHTVMATYAFSSNVGKADLQAADDHAASIGRDASFQLPPPAGLKKPDMSWADLSVGAQDGNIELIRAALAQGAQVNEEIGVSTPLGIAAGHGQLGAVDFLLRHGAAIEAKYGIPKRTALHEASLKGHLEVVRFLVESGANVNARNKNGRTALFYAVSPPPPLTKPSNSDAVGAYLRSVGGAL